MTFEELKEVEHGSVLVSKNGTERYFMGFVPNEDRVATYELDSHCSDWWVEQEIKNWTLKKPEPKYEIFEEWYYPVSEQLKMLPSTVSSCYERTDCGDSVEAFKVEGGRKIKVYEDGRAEVINE